MKDSEKKIEDLRNHSKTPWLHARKQVIRLPSCLTLSPVKMTGQMM